MRDESYGQMTVGELSATVAGLQATVAQTRSEYDQHTRELGKRLAGIKTSPDQLRADYIAGRITVDELDDCMLYSLKARES